MTQMVVGCVVLAGMAFVMLKMLIPPLRPGDRVSFFGDGPPWTTHRPE